MKILVLNAGSSSQKTSLYEVKDRHLPQEPQKPIWSGQIDWNHHQGEAEMKVKTARGEQLEQTFQADSRTFVMSEMFKTLSSGSTQVISDNKEIDIVGHRVVHGGNEYQQSTFINSEVKAAIKRLSIFAPVHNPVNLEGIETTGQILANVPQVAVFDTAFHSTLPPAAFVYPVPYEWLNEGIRRYGFHGISHQYCSHRAAQILGRDLQDLRLINCHLGNGCSLAAISGGLSIDTTMGFTPLEGLMMGSRSGSIDPGILLYILRQTDSTPDKLDNILNRQSGLQGISGVSSDLRSIMEAIAQGNPRAKLAFDMFVHRLRSYIGAMLASLAGLDALIFTAGIGENSAHIRAATCEGFSFLGLKLDLTKNLHSPIDEDIATSDSKVRVLVIHTQEDWAIARECWQLSKDRNLVNI